MGHIFIFPFESQNRRCKYASHMLLHMFHHRLGYIVSSVYGRTVQPRLDLCSTEDTMYYMSPVLVVLSCHSRRLPMHAFRQPMGSKDCLHILT
jgi:hypothetical protein